MEINAIRVVFPATFWYQSHQSHLTPRRANPARSHHHLARHFPPFRAVTSRWAESNWTGRFHPGLNTKKRAARRSGEEYLLQRGLFRRMSIAVVVQPAYLEFAFPYYWHYDVLRALDYFRRSGADPDPRMSARARRAAGIPSAR